MNIVLLGIQGAGKSTQGNLLSKQLKIPYLSTGHIFREIAKEKTSLGRQVKEIINTGSLIPDTKTIEIVSSYLKRPEYAHGFILDGFPRTVNQAQSFHILLTKVIYLHIDEKEALWRLSMRDDSGREDNTIQAVQKRIQQFEDNTRPVLKHYEIKEILSVVDAQLTVEKVNEEILKSLGKEIIDHHLSKWKNKKKTLLCITGLPGSGKTEAMEYFRTKGFPALSFGDIVNGYIDKHHLEHTEDVHKKVRLDLREKHGPASLAIISTEEIKKHLSESPIVILGSVYTWEEYLYLKNTFPDADVVVLAIYADKALRYARQMQREYRKGLFGEARDINELTTINKGPLIAFADYLVKNNFSKQEFLDKLDEVYRAIYFS
ncbi:MAG: nucleoside monophosphate kinase [Candidatus Roizmanbacteria bacterium]